MWGRRKSRRQSAVVLLLLLATSLPAQQDGLTFRSSTTLVEFTFTALDGKGHPVLDLKKEEVSILENGHSRQASLFRFEGVQEKTAAPEPLPAGVFTNRAEYSAGWQRNVTVLVLDAINTPPEDQASALTQISRYLEGIPRGFSVAAYRLGRRIALLHDFTDDPGKLRAGIATYEVTLREELATIGHMPAGAEIPMRSGSAEMAAGAAEARRAERQAMSQYDLDVRGRRLAATLAGLEALGDRLAGIPGRKNLVWISHGMPIRLMQASGFPKSYSEPIRKTARRLASQGITIYPVVELRGMDPRALAAMEVFAEVSGGRVVKPMIDLSQGLTVGTRST